MFLGSIYGAGVAAKVTEMMSEQATAVAAL